MKTVAPCKILTERCFLAERASVKRTVKITSEPDSPNEEAVLQLQPGWYRGKLSSLIRNGSGTFAYCRF